MAIPMDTLINKQGNMYELTCVTIKRAAFLTKFYDEELELHDDKIVSTSLTQVLDDRVEYHIGKEE